MKGNMFLGMARGSVGDVTFSRLNGQQVARARNRKPANPRTQAQVRQRTIFMSATKFYTRGVKNFFQFAFEDKKATESDYNAFMRHNAKAGIYFRAEDYDNVNVPAIGAYEVTHGSMVVPNYECYISDNNHPVAQFNVNGVGAATSTIGALSTAIKSQYGLLEGDIVTILVVSSGAKLNEDGDYAARGLMVLDGDPVKWSMVQFIIDTNSTATLASIGLGVAQNLVTFEVASANGLDAAACAVVFSRKTASGLKVSTSILSLNQAADAILGEGNYNATDPSWLETVLASWSAREEAILEGAIADSVNAPAPPYPNPFQMETEIPATILTEDESADGLLVAYGTREISADDMRAHLAMSFSLPVLKVVEDWEVYESGMYVFIALLDNGTDTPERVSLNYLPDRRGMYAWAQRASIQLNEFDWK